MNLKRIPNARVVVSGVTNKNGTPTSSFSAHNCGPSLTTEHKRIILSLQFVVLVGRVLSYGVSLRAGNGFSTKVFYSGNLNESFPLEKAKNRNFFGDILPYFPLYGLGK